MTREASRTDTIDTLRGPVRLWKSFPVGYLGSEVEALRLALRGFGSVGRKIYLDHNKTDIWVHVRYFLP